MMTDDIDSLSWDDLRTYARSLRHQLANSGQDKPPGRNTSRQIYLYIYGGLGNQLFQAAFALMMAEALEAEINILTVSYRDDELRPFLLHLFPGIRARIVPAADALGAPMIEEQMVRHLPIETIVADLSAIIQNTGRLYFSGFWQDERYFKERSHSIRKLLQPEVSEAVAKKAREARDSEAIGLHVRRHGYGHMGLVHLSYYFEAIHQIRQEKGDLPIKCFTDDPSFCRYSFRKIDGFSIADDGNLYNPIANFHTLSSCRHHIIANSSFSWWAAWLNERDDTIVYAPHPWIIPDRETNPVPSRWRQLANAILAP